MPDGIGIDQKIREVEDRSFISLLESPTLLQQFMEIASTEIARMLDFTHVERINRSIIPPGLSKLEADRLYRVQLRGVERSVWIYVLVEHQSKIDDWMPVRLLSFMVELFQYQARAWEDEKKSLADFRLEMVLPVVFYTGKPDWSKTIALTNLMDIPEELRAYVPMCKTLFLPLHHTDPEELKASEATFAQILRAWQLCDAPEEQFATTLAEIASRLDALPQSDIAEWRRAMIFLYNLVLNKRTEEEREELSAILGSHVERHTDEWKGIEMTGAEYLIRQGLEQGIPQGERGLTLRLLMDKFNISLENAHTLLDRVPDDRVSVIARRLLVVNSLADLDLTTDH